VYLGLFGIFSKFHFLLLMYDMTKKVSKKIKKVTKKKLLSLARTAKRKNLSEWSKQVRERDGECIVCKSKNHLNAHHILAKETYEEFMFENQNGVSLCPIHHKFGKYSAHKNPIWFVKFLQDFRADQYTWACANAGGV
jgi:hypothetical protein